MNQRFLLGIFAVITLFVAGCETQLVRHYPPPPPPPPVVQAPAVSLADIKASARAGLSDDAIIGKIQDSHSIYRLSSDDIVDLKTAGVSSKVIDFMISTANQAPAAIVGSEGSVPPPPVTEQAIVSPGPQYAWVGGYWDWDGLRWVWLPGRWSVPPYPHAVWVAGYWGHRRHRWVWISAHWR